MNKKYISAVALMTMALAGCTQAVEPVKTNPQPVRNLPGISTQVQIPTTPTIETNDLGIILKDGDPTKVPQVTQQSTEAGLQKPTLVTKESTDQKKYATAVKNNDSKLCELIIDATTKAACIRDIAATSQDSKTKAVVTTDQGSTSQENL
jgi:hypothetical protein